MLPTNEPKPKPKDLDMPVDVGLDAMRDHQDDILDCFLAFYAPARLYKLHKKLRTTTSLWLVWYSHLLGSSDLVGLFSKVVLPKVSAAFSVE